MLDLSESLFCMYSTGFIILYPYIDAGACRKVPALLAFEDGNRCSLLSPAQNSASVSSDFGIILSLAASCALMLNGTDPVRPPG